MIPKVSSIIPAFNCQNFIGNAVKSIIEQQYENIEIIIVNDGSSDATFEQAEILATKYPQIILCQNERNKGPSGARNTGLERATGEYITFLDADDIWLPDHLKYGVNFLEKNKEISVVFFNFNITDFKSKKIISNWFSERDFIKNLNTVEIQQGYYLIDDDIFGALLDESFMHLQSMIIKQNACKGIFFEENVMRSEDRDFSIKLAIESKAKFAFSDVITGNYYRYNNTLTSPNINNSINTVNDHIFLFLNYLKKYDVKKFQIKQINELLYSRYLLNSYSYRKCNCFGNALKTLANSLKYKIRIAQFVELSKIMIEFFCFILHIKLSKN